jgi:SulP family sulfate permease
VEFGWVLREAVGGGMVEVFETGSVGRGVRVI